MWPSHECLLGDSRYVYYRMTLVITGVEAVTCVSPPTKPSLLKSRSKLKHWYLHRACP